MKKLVLLTLLVTGFTFAQNSNKFSITESVKHNREVEKYIALIIISEDLAYNNYESPQTYDQIKTNYFNRLRNKDVNTDMLKENKEAYFHQYGYRRKGSVFVLETSSKKEFLNVLSTRTDGVNVYEKSVEFKPLTDAQVAEFSKKALSKAKKRATLIAAASGKKIGKILEINHIPNGETTEYYNEKYNRQNFSVSVVYELLD
ncbi:MAG: hypothetical protein CSA39_01075 [Flavobacteriales bacterium]|nr:MAG: hypothetical protein CSA39_01075 [Flavobacteriales bacterium]